MHSFSHKDSSRITSLNCLFDHKLYAHIYYGSYIIVNSNQQILRSFDVLKRVHNTKYTMQITKAKFSVSFSLRWARFVSRISIVYSLKIIIFGFYFLLISSSHRNSYVLRTQTFYFKIPAFFVVGRISFRISKSLSLIFPGCQTYSNGDNLYLHSELSKKWNLMQHKNLLCSNVGDELFLTLYSFSFLPHVCVNFFNV